MKTLKEIKNNESQQRYGQPYNDCLDWVDRTELSRMDEQIAKDFAIEVAKEALRNAAYPKDEYGNNIELVYEGHDYHVPQSSILSETNIPEL